MNIEQICSRNVVHIPQACSLREAAVQMRKQHVGALLVTEDGNSDAHVIGVVTDRDIVVHGVASGRDPQAIRVAEVMTGGLVAIEEGTSVSDTLQEMMSHGVRRIAVKRRDGTLIGVVSMDDVIGALGTDWAMLAGILRSGAERERSGSVQSPLHM